MTLIAADLDGTWLNHKLDPPPTLIITGRLWDQYDKVARNAAMHMPVYIRGVGEKGDEKDIARFKAAMINLLGVTRYYENVASIADHIKASCKDCKVVLVGK